jgi:hypothetical protein
MICYTRATEVPRCQAVRDKLFELMRHWRQRLCTIAHRRLIGLDAKDQTLCLAASEDIDELSKFTTTVSISFVDTQKWE